MAVLVNKTTIVKPVGEVVITKAITIPEIITVRVVVVEEPNTSTITA